MRKYLFLAVVVMIVVGLLAATGLAAKMMMDGSKWKIEMKMVPMKAGAKPMPDTLTFGKGMMDSMACHKYGIYKGKYTEGKMMGKEMTWSANIKGGKGMGAMWKGKMVGEKISGTATFTQKGKKPMMYEFTGMKEKAGMKPMMPPKPKSKPKAGM